MRRSLTGIILAVWVLATLSAAGLMLLSEERYVYLSANALARTIGADAFTTGTSCEPILNTDATLWFRCPRWLPWR